MSTEFGDEKTCFSPFRLRQRAQAVSQGWSGTSIGCRPSLSSAWRISPGCPWIDHFRGFGIRFDNTFLLLLHGLFFSFAFCFRVHMSISTSHSFFFCRITGTVCTRGTDTFSVLAHSFSPFVSHFDTQFLHLGDSPVHCGVQGGVENVQYTTNHKRKFLLFYGWLCTVRFQRPLVKLCVPRSRSHNM